MNQVDNKNKSLLIALKILQTLHVIISTFKLTGFIYYFKYLFFMSKILFKDSFNLPLLNDINEHHFKESAEIETTL